MVEYLLFFVGLASWSSTDKHNDGDNESYDNGATYADSYSDDDVLVDTVGTEHQVIWFAASRMKF
jgi:hypothetical protein